ncbi:nitrilase-related carbon-nitrogen hydrolase [Temperatibacter marinus]|uniref:Nitrilase-related carbon-nitrogen hydrolase n=1 Tax=Temperatibacter marinus TaxID=1456591 RepID=A0AA52HBE3_9PROT|nr:nitrilase-related carbon-nitrogen hydrolase [Temperatibacter marinus]WND03548.1 nitrilase-related carbon-nitrogen hydrolase [Temperatibacter marinus]
MISKKKLYMRVAALQFQTTSHVPENLNTCLRLIDEAALQSPNLMVLGEFSNHLSWYDDQKHAWEVALEIGGNFLQKIAEKARRHSCYIDINVTLRRAENTITVTSLLYDPEGQLIAEADKQTLMGHENIYFERASAPSPVIETPYGRLGLFPCRDGVTFETPRGLALRGAQLFCDSLNSFALDEATLHVPARAPENKCFLVSANKVGPLIPEILLNEVARATQIPKNFLYGAGGSQIVHPNGTILARASLDKEEVIVADICLSEADDKSRPDGTHLFTARRPDLYTDIVDENACIDCGAAQAEVKAVTLSVTSVNDLLAQALVIDPWVKIIVLSGNFIAKESELEQIIQICKPYDWSLCTRALIEEDQFVVLIGKGKILAQQKQIHKSHRSASKTLAKELITLDLEWGRVAMMHSDDAAYPEIVKVAALKGIHTLLVPADFQEQWEWQYGLPSRAAENRICVIAADKEKSMIASLEREFTIMTTWEERQFDGKINEPLLAWQVRGKPYLEALFHPQAACNKVMSEATDLLKDRPWFLSEALIKEEHQ